MGCDRLQAAGANGSGRDGRLWPEGGGARTERSGQVQSHRKGGLRERPRDRPARQLQDGLAALGCGDLAEDDQQDGVDQRDEESHEDVAHGAAQELDDRAVALAAGQEAVVEGCS